MTLRKWAAGIAAFVLLAATAAPALATTYYVNGSYERGPSNKTFEQILIERNARAGTSSALAWGTLAKANATVKSGDVVVLERAVSANYNGNINPTCQDTASGWVTYIGALDHPEYASIAVSGGATLSKPYVSIKGVSFTAATNFTMSGARDSVQYSTFAGDVFDWSATDYSFIANCHMNGSRFIGDACEECDECTFGCAGSDSTMTSVVFNNNHFTRLFSSPGTTANDFVVSGADSCTFRFNAFDISDGGPVEGPSTYFDLTHSHYTTFYGNRWNYSSVIPASGQTVARLRSVRDRATYITFKRDSVYQIGNELVQFGFSNSGHFINGCTADEVTTSHLTYDSCYIHLKNSEYGVSAQEQVNQATFTRNVVINETGPAFVVMNGVVGRNYIDHNTFVGGPISGSNPHIMEIWQDGQWSDTTLVTNNIFYALGQVAPVPYTPTASAVQYSAADYDSTFVYGETDHANHLISDHNLYSYYGPSLPDTLGKRSIGWWNRLQLNYSWPGGNAVLRSSATTYDSVTIDPGGFADTVAVVAGVFGDTVIVASGVFADTITVTLPAHLPLSDSTFKIAVVRTVITPPSGGKLAVSRTVVTPPSSGKLPVVRTVKTAPSSGKLAATQTTTLGAFLPNTLWSVKWCHGCDDSSRYGSPVFADSSFAGFNPVLGYGSLAHEGGSGGGDVGAIAYTHPPSLSVTYPGEIVFHIPAVISSQFDSIYIYNASVTDSAHINGNGAPWDNETLMLDAGLASTYDAAYVIGPRGSQKVVVEFASRAWNAGPYYRANTQLGTYYMRYTTDDPLNPVILIPVRILPPVQ